MLTEVSQTRYVVKVRGVAVSAPQPTRQLAEAAMLSLPSETRAIAEIAIVAPDGKELLLG